MGEEKIASPRLSILLPTVAGRAALFDKLHSELIQQAQGRSVEILFACDNKEISIGKKRQNLLEMATGEWVVFVDDDDWVPPSYVDDILTALETCPDCVGFLITCTTNGRNPQKAIASMKYKRWGDNQDGFRFVRSIYHKTPVKREIAARCKFPDIRYGEDKSFSECLMRHVKTEVFIPKVLYHYRFRNEPFAQKYGFPEHVDRARKTGPVTRSSRLDRKGRKVG